MNKRSAIFSETEFYSRDRRRDPDLFRKKHREKTLEELEKENEDKLTSQLYYMNILYNHKETPIKNDNQTTDFIVELLKESILSERIDLFFFNVIKRQKRRNSFDLTQEISVNQYINSLNLSIQTNYNKASVVSLIKNNSTQTINDDDSRNGMMNGGNKSNNTFSNYFNCPHVNMSLAQNIMPEENIRLMFVSHSRDLIARSMIMYFMYNHDCNRSDNYDFTIKKRLYQLNTKDTVLLTIYDTKMPFHCDSTSRSYYNFTDLCVYFINNNNSDATIQEEVKTIYNNFSQAKRVTQLIVLSHAETSIELKQNIQLLSQSIMQYDVESSDDIRIVLHKLITNFLLRKAPIKKPLLLDEDEYQYAISDDLNCGSAYSMDEKDDDFSDEDLDSISKFGRSKSIR